MKRSISFLLMMAVLFVTRSVPCAAQSPEWACYGPYGGRVLALALSPAYGEDQTLFAGTDGSGALRERGRCGVLAIR